MARDDYRRGMLYGFAAAGLSPEAVGELALNLTKQANGLTGALDSGAETTLGLAAGIPIATGVLGGAAAYKMFGPDYKANIDSLRTQDIINEIRMRRRDVQRNLAKKV